jgi:hypothetical protein
MTGPPAGVPPPTEEEARAWMQVTGLVSSQQMAAISRQLWYLTNWVQYLNSFDWSQVPQKPGGPAGAPPPPPPKWPP